MSKMNDDLHFFDSSNASFKIQILLIYLPTYNLSCYAEEFKEDSRVFKVNVILLAYNRDYSLFF